jgi:hypothetical protein
MQILKSEKFQKEYNEFNSIIKNITNEEVKKDLENDLSLLVKSIKFIDQLHSELGFRKTFPGEIEDNRLKIVEIRKRLLRRIKEWNAQSN